MNISEFDKLYDQLSPAAQEAVQMVMKILAATVAANNNKQPNQVGVKQC